MKPIRAHLAAGMLALCLIGPAGSVGLGTPARADQLGAGRAAFARGDFRAAARLLGPLAERGNARAQTTLGYMYETGQGVPQAYDVAVYWYQCAAERGDTTAQYLLGLMYNRGLGVPLDEVTAYTWLNLAAAGAPKNIRETYARLRDAVASKMSTAQIAEGQARALQWSAGRR